MKHRLFFYRLSVPFLGSGCLYKSNPQKVFKTFADSYACKFYFFKFSINGKRRTER